MYFIAQITLMEIPGDEEKLHCKSSEIKIFSVPYNLEEFKEVFFDNINIYTQYNKEEIIKNQAFKLHIEGDIFEASKYYKSYLNQGFIDPRVLSNYGTICKKNGQIQLAMILFRK